jgi:heme-degrading monooxygenase HmoA
MAIGIYFPVEGMTPDKYQQVHARLSEAGQGNPEGRSSHTGFQVGDEVKVFDVWDSQEAFEAFGQHLVPILEEAGVSTGEPVIGQVLEVNAGGD